MKNDAKETHMKFRPSPATRALFGAIAWLAAAQIPARADEPSPAAIEIATKIVGQLGLKQTLDSIVPALFTEFERGVLQSRPELKDSLHQTLVALLPEFNKGETNVISDVAHVMAAKLSEPELKEVVAFYDSPTGKKFVEAEPAFVAELQISGRNWRQKISQDLLPRVREELKKKGVDF
jgi:hypothetical protein